MDDRAERCETCRFWEGQLKATDVVAYGPCHRFPPIPTAEDQHWPVTLDTDWCGEWQAIPLPVVATGVPPVDAWDWLLGCLGPALRKAISEDLQVANLQELCTKTAADFRRSDNVGVAKVERLRRMLAALGLKLRGDP